MSSKKVTEFHEIIDNNQLLEYVRNQKFGSPTSIQARAIPALMKDGHYQVKQIILKLIKIFFLETRIE